MQKEPKNFIGAKPLLFDRLVDDFMNEPFESSDQLYLSIEDVKKSVHKELILLLNTRSSGLTADDLLTKEGRPPYGIPSFYGMPDFTAYDAAASQDWPIIEKLIAKTISYFDKRLCDVTVKVLRFNDQDQALNVQIQATLKIKKISEEVTFDVAIDCGKER